MRPEDSIGQIVTDCSSLSRVFDALDIDYCCHGDRTLLNVCEERGLEPLSVARVLQAVAQSMPRHRRVDCSRMSLTELADHIEQTHHDYLRIELPRLTELIDEVHKRHDSCLSLFELKEVFAKLHADLREHVLHEEQLLFPVVRDIDKSYSLRALQGFSVNTSIKDLNHGHEEDYRALERLRDLTDNFTPPEGASNAWRALLEGLADLDYDLHEHIHKETNILFPKAAETEAWLDAAV
ncbi:MAG: DUF542 domain-containing protein [Planctomycetota bacterium]|nr:DUF542 domain-containing protein [Planctomycetota bacterium]MDA1140034.1 DUF542 domain-containing protein [Planctomycetota bacterium]